MSIAGHSIAAMFALFLAIVSPQAASGHDFDRLTPLVGHWRGTSDDGRAIDIRYRLIANDTALVEEWTAPSGRRTMTVYHRDGRRVIATHYCAQGNQPRLVLRPAAGGPLRFTFHDATNLATPGDDHLHDFWIDSDGRTTMRRAETYRRGRAATTEAMTLRRVE